EDPTGLRFARHLEFDMTAEGRHLDHAAQRCSGETDRRVARQVDAVASEDGMLTHPNLDIEIARRPAIAPRLTLAGETDAIAGVDARRSLHRQGLLPAHPPLPKAGVARLGDDLTAALAARTRLLHGEEALLQAHLTDAVAGLAGHGARPGRGARALAGFTFGERRKFHFGGVAKHGLLEIQLELVAQIGAAEHLAPAASPASAAEDVAVHIAEIVGEGVRGAEAAAGPAASGQALMAVLVVDRPLLRVGKRLVGFLGFLEALLGLPNVGVTIGMELHRKAPVRLLDFGFRGGA